MRGTTLRQPHPEVESCRVLLKESHMAAALLSLFRSSLRTLLPRRVGSPLPTMHSLRMHGGQQGCLPRGSLSARRPLRVVQSRGRLVISGRMADVSAELDSLVAL